MQNIVQRDACHRWRRCRKQNSTDANYPTRVSQFAAPSDGYGDSPSQTTAGAAINLGYGFPWAPRQAVMKFFGTDTDGLTLKAKLLGYTFVPGTLQGDSDGYWDVQDIFEVTCTLSSSVTGVAGKVVPETQYFADTIVVVANTAIANESLWIISPANDRAAVLVTNIYGFDWVEPIFYRNGSATSCNGLIRFI